MTPLHGKPRSFKEWWDGFNTWVQLLIVGVGILITFALISSMLGGGSDGADTTSQPQTVTRDSVSRDSVSPAASMTALEQMELVFVGGHTESQIEPVLRTAMSLYGLANTETNRRRVGDVLVTLRREYGQPEMVILDHMIRSHEWRDY